VGMAAMLMGSFKVFTLAFPKERFSTLIGILMSVGTVGNMLAASPFAYLAGVIGWRTAFVWTGIITGLLGVVAFFLLSNVGWHTRTLQSTAQQITFKESARLILRSLPFWQISVASFFRYGTLVSLQGVWLGLYLIQVKGFTPVQAGNVLLFLAIGNAVGGPIGGRAIDGTPLSEKQVALGGLIFYCLSLLLLTGVWHWQQLEVYMAIAFSLGFFHAVATLLHAHAKVLYPLSVAATAMSWVNFCVMAGAALLTTAFGKFIELFPRSGSSYPPEAYHFCFLMGFILMAGSVIFYAFSPSKPSPANK
jgi:predicted MFS family arabinose efflux permease